MAKITVTVGSMVSAHARLTDVLDDKKNLEFKQGKYISKEITRNWVGDLSGTYTNRSEVISLWNGQHPDKQANYVRLDLDVAHLFNETVKTTEYSYPEFIFDEATFDYMNLATPNAIVENYGPSFFDKHIGSIVDNYTDNQDTNKQISDQFKKTFLRKFWGYEIGQENPLYWCLLVKEFMDEQMPLFVQSWKQLVVDNQQWTTYITHQTSDTVGNVTGAGNSTTNSTGHTKGSSIQGVADTPQNGLDFDMVKEKTLDDYNVTDDYTFNYASQVTGARNKGEDDSTSTTKSDDKQDSKNHNDTNGNGRSDTIVSLINEMETFMNGAYQNIFAKAFTYGLFIQGGF